MIVAVVPARWASSRLPGKPLADIGGLPMVERVRRAVVASRAVDRAIVATDDERIAAAVLAHGGEAVLTGEAANGTHRVALATPAEAELVINVQGDVPLLDPAHVVAVADLLRGRAEIATLAAPLHGDPEDPDVVKVVCDDDGRALYFSRRAIPHHGPWLRHLGLYGFRAETLRRVVQLPPGGLERSEDLEQLRWMAAGIGIRVRVVDGALPGVDTPEQLEEVRRLVARRGGP